MPKIPIVFDVGAFPEGWEGDLQEHANQLAELLTGEIDGDFPAGQLGGSRPSQDVGIWYDTAGLGIEMWNGSKYVPIITVPVGSMLDWAARSDATIPANFIECDGSLLQQSEYPDLYDVLRDTWGTAPNAETFYLPDPTGRVVVGLGVGSYKPEGSNGYNVTGNLDEYSNGEYFGRESIYPRQMQTGGPSSGLYKLKDQSNGNGVVQPGTVNYMSCVQPGLACRKIIRYR